MSASLLEPATLRRLRRLTLLGRKAVANTHHGERRSRQRGTSLNFVDYRQYVSGDDVSQIDWNVYGRLDTLVVKLFEDEQNVTVHLLIDNSKSMNWGQPNKLHVAAQLMAALGYVGLSNFDKLECSTFADRLTGHYGPIHSQREAQGLFQFLGQVKGTGETNFENSLKEYALAHPRPGLAVIVSDLLTHSSFESGLRFLLQRHYDVVLLHLLAPAEIHPTMGGDLKLVDSETGSMVDVTLNQRALSLYRERYQRWTAVIERFCARRGVLYERLDSSDSLDHMLFGTFRKRGLVA